MHHSDKYSEILLGTSFFRETLNNCHSESGEQSMILNARDSSLCSE